MQPYRIPIWKTSPFCRLILPLIAGIMLQWYWQLPIPVIIFSLVFFSTTFFLFYFLPIAVKSRLQFLQGILLMLMVLFFAGFLVWAKDIRHSGQWYGGSYSDSSILVIRINEPLTEKIKSFKAEGYVEYVIKDKKVFAAEGKLFIYFARDSEAQHLCYGDRILVRSNLQRIKNSGNPGAFNYERYGAFQQVFYTQYLKSNDWILLNTRHTNWLRKFIFSLQTGITGILKKYISGDKNVLGIAEALLIGYKQDLDKDLVQAYSNAGVVHIIAISGLHLGLIYFMLIWICDRLAWIKKQKFLKLILVLGCLWLFSLLTGASASVLRSAVMFTCVMIGKGFYKQAPIYNSLAASAFILLCYDPCFLWDVGFQLSYLAIVGIVSLQRPIGNLLFFKAKWLRLTWNMFAVTLAAQVLTFPICIYYFHQFPNLFFITNLVAVPLSTFILFAEIFLIVFSWIDIAGIYLGKLTGGFIWLMNAIIRFCNDLPFSLLDNIYANIITTCFLYLFVMAVCAWLINKDKRFFQLAIAGLLGFVFSHVIVNLELQQQKKIIVYNVPQHQAIDFIYKDRHCFIGDSSLVVDGALKNFHLKPTRISLQATSGKTGLPGLYRQNKTWQFFGKRLMMIDTGICFEQTEKKMRVDVLIISKNPSIKIKNLAGALTASLVVFDASNSLWKIAGWKKECESLALPCISIPEKGAFILDIE